MSGNYLSKRIEDIYEKLYRHFGPQYWWPGDSPFEVIIGAILTQNTNWQNVSRAIDNLKKAKVLSPGRLHALPLRRLANLIKPSGYFNIKAKRLRSFLDFFFKEYNGSLKKMFSQNADELRKALLDVRGIGPETADSILLYAGDFPIFVVDGYTKRIFSRKKIVDEKAGYDEVQEMFMQNLKKDVQLYNEYHALIVRLGKDVCKKSKPKCEICPIR